MSHLAFIDNPVSDTTGVVENLVEFIVQMPDSDAGAISLGLAGPETLVNTNIVNGSGRFGKMFNNQQRSNLERFNREIYSSYLIEQAQCKNAAWEVFLQQALAFQSDRIVLQRGDALSYNFTVLPWWFALAQYFQACLAAEAEISLGKKVETAEESDEQSIQSLATCARDQLANLLHDKSAGTSPADLIVMHQFCLAWASKINGLRDRLTRLQQEEFFQKRIGRRRDKQSLRDDLLEQSMQTQLEALERAQAQLLTLSPLTYFSAPLEVRKPHPLTSEAQMQLLENIVRQDRAYGLQRWIARELVGSCGADLPALQQVSKLFWAICTWTAQASADQYLAYQWKTFLLYCYELFALEYGMRNESLLRNLPPDCIGLADAAQMLCEAFDLDDQDSNPEGAKKLFLTEYRGYQERDAGLIQELQKRRKATHNVRGS